MKNRFGSRLGFTLIELLVVVLIIGVLSAVSLPQYRKSILKARRANAVSLARGLKPSFEAFYLRNNRYPVPGQEFLDMIDFPGKTCTPTCDLYSHCACRVGDYVMEYVTYNSGRGMGLYVLYGPGTELDISGVTPNVGAALMTNSAVDSTTPENDVTLYVRCLARSNDDFSKKICESLPQERKINNGGTIFPYVGRARPYLTRS